MLASRSVSEQDRAKLIEWIAADPDHAGKSTPDFWIQDTDGIKCFAIQDALGDIFFVRCENVMRLHIQFAPQNEKRRTARAIDEFTTMIAAGAKANRYKQLIFESVFQPLIDFLAKRGFRASKNEQVLDL